MKPIPAALFTAVLAVGGVMARGKSPSIDHGIGLGGVALGLSVLYEIDESFGKAFGLLIVFGTLAFNFEVITKKMGLA